MWSTNKYKIALRMCTGTIKDTKRLCQWHQHWFIFKTDACNTSKYVYLLQLKDYMEFSNPENDNSEKDSRVTMNIYLNSSPQCSGVGKKARMILR